MLELMQIQIKWTTQHNYYFPLVHEAGCLKVKVSVE